MKKQHLGHSHNSSAEVAVALPSQPGEQPHTHSHTKPRVFLAHCKNENARNPILNVYNNKNTGNPVKKKVFFLNGINTKPVEY